MGDLFLLSEAQMARISPCFSLSHGVPWVDDRRVVSGIVYVIKHGLQWEVCAQRVWAGQDAFLLTEGQMSDHKSARMMLKALPSALALIADMGYNSDWFREALTALRTAPCIPPTRSRRTPLDYDKGLYRQ